MNITTIGFDLAKNVFQVHGVSEQGLAQHRLTLLADPVDLKDILCQIKPNRRNVHRCRSCRFEWLRNTSTLAPLMPCRAGASMPLLIPSGNPSQEAEPPLQMPRPRAIARRRAPSRHLDPALDICTRFLP